MMDFTARLDLEILIWITVPSKKNVCMPFNLACLEFVNIPYILYLRSTHLFQI